MVKQKIFITLLLFLCLLNLSKVDAQNNIRVTGTVEAAADNKPIKEVSLWIDGIFICNTNVDGNFSIVVPRDASIVFSHSNYTDRTISLGGRQQLLVTLQDRVVEMEQVVVSIKAKRAKIGVEPTDLEVRGNYLHISTKYYVPNELFKTDCRFVAQPIIEDRTLGVKRILRPVVIDGDMYHKIQQRWLNLGDTPDKLRSYIVDNNITSDNKIYSYKDSVYIGATDPKFGNEYLSNCYLALVDYNEPPRFLDTVTIARGVSNPLRHFEYNLKPMQLDESILDEDKEPYLTPTGADTIFIPEYEMKLQQKSGIAKIQFELGRAEINHKDAVTKIKIAEIQQFIERLQNNPDATIKSISLCGYASPDGLYARNQALALTRTQEMQRVILSTLSPLMLQYVKLNIDSKVESWNKVVELATPKHPKLAHKIQSIINSSNGNYNTMYHRIAQLPEYRGVITKYLNDLRTVTYDIEYSIYMPTPYSEVRVKYDNGEELSRYEYYTLIANERDKSLLPQIEAKALEVYPNFTIVANRRAIQLIKQDSANLDILSPLMNNAPLPIIYNQSLMAIKSRNFDLADSLATICLGDIAELKYLRNVTRVLSGNIEDAYPYFESEKSLNKVVLLLAMKKNREALSVMDSIMQVYENQYNAKYCYVYAICMNRVDDLGGAMHFLQLAISLDMSFEEAVKTDSDLLEIYELLQHSNGDEKR